jgi:hypothetical protein
MVMKKETSLWLVSYVWRPNNTIKIREKKRAPGRYQRLDFFIKVLRVLCPNLPDASMIRNIRKNKMRLERKLDTRDYSFFLLSLYIFYLGPKKHKNMKRKGTDLGPQWIKEEKEKGIMVKSLNQPPVKGN